MLLFCDFMILQALWLQNGKRCLKDSFCPTETQELSKNMLEWDCTKGGCHNSCCFSEQILEV